MTRTEKELEEAARVFENWDELDPSTLTWTDGSDLRQVAHATDAVRAAEERLLKAVIVARENGRSWNRIAIGLDVSRQAARQRFADKVEA